MTTLHRQMQRATQRGQRPSQRVNARFVAHIEDALHLGRLGIEQTGKVCLAFALFQKGIVQKDFGIDRFRQI